MITFSAFEKPCALDPLLRFKTSSFNDKESKLRISAANALLDDFS